MKLGFWINWKFKKTHVYFQVNNTWHGMVYNKDCLGNNTLLQYRWYFGPVFLEVLKYV